MQIVDIVLYIIQIDTSVENTSFFICPYNVISYFFLDILYISVHS
jgi:hypothetical protein